MKVIVSSDTLKSGLVKALRRADLFIGSMNDQLTLIPIDDTLPADLARVATSSNRSFSHAPPFEVIIPRELLVDHLTARLQDVGLGVIARRGHYNLVFRDRHPTMFARPSPEPAQPRI